MKSPEPLESLAGWSGGLLAHQGGWDEILLVLGPLAVVGLLLWVANRRVAKQLEEDREVEGVEGAEPSDRPDPA